jgi:CubicO group peptidase (beta-lactamase class C family)
MRNRSSKVFGAVMAQLIEAGRIPSIDDPVSLYLHRVPLSGAKAAITLRDLLTHRGGFDSAAFGLGTKQAFSSPLPVAELSRYSRPLVRPPGTLSVYSNYEIGLLGQLARSASTA